MIVSLLALFLVACGSGSSTGQGDQQQSGDLYADSIDSSADGGVTASDLQSDDAALDTSIVADLWAADLADDGGGTSDSQDDALGTDTTPDGVSDHLSLSNLTAGVTTLASDEFDGREPGTEGWKKARAYLLEQLAACGLQPAGTDGYQQPVTTGIGVNLLARVDGRDDALRNRVVLLSAHYDHIGHCGGFICNGALDNAAAVTSVVAIGCALVSNPPARSVLIALWDTEEPPTFLTEQMGSEFFAANPTLPLSAIDVAIVLDLYGGNFWGDYKGHLLFGAELSPELRAALDATAVPAGLEPLRLGLHVIEEWYYGHEAWSDYDAFRNRNIPFLFISDGINKVYHTSEDDVSHLDLPKLAIEAQYLHDIVLTLANAQKTPTFVANGADYLRDAVEILALYDAVLAPVSGLVDTLVLSDTSAALLQSDYLAVQQTKADLDGGAVATKKMITSLRTAVQRILCLAGSLYPESACNI
ncbi:MAG: M28 family peptidase [Myxococcales bacterium]|nr:M28 family peptidase [Myxococcales bacterium]